MMRNCGIKVRHFSDPKGEELNVGLLYRPNSTHIPVDDLAFGRTIMLWSAGFFIRLLMEIYQVPEITASQLAGKISRHRCCWVIA